MSEQMEIAALDDAPPTFAAGGARVEGIYLAAGRGGPRRRVASVEAVQGKGLAGDRHFGLGPNRWAEMRQVTLIEAEAVESLAERGISLSHGEARRNLMTRGVRLNGLVGRTFRVGGVLLRGAERCDPCSHLERLTQRGVMRGLRDHGGLRAEVLQDGEIREGDEITPE